MALIELIGQETGTQTVRIERGPVKVFAQALLDDDSIYDSDSAPVPPTYPFVMHFWGTVDQEGTPGLPIERLRGAGRAILHGEQGFTYTRWPRVGDVLAVALLNPWHGGPLCEWTQDRPGHFSSVTHPPCHGVPTGEKPGGKRRKTGGQNGACRRDCLTNSWGE